MFCAHCSDKIVGKPIRQGGEHFCSLECANLASGLDLEETEGYYDEYAVEDFYNEDE